MNFTRSFNYRSISMVFGHQMRHRGTRMLVGLICGLIHSVTFAAEPPNIVVLLADDMGMGDTSAYQDWSGNADHEQLATPAMEQLAKIGVRFTDAHAPHSRCTTTRYALMTGRYCWRTRLKHWVLFGTHGDPLIERSRITFPEFLRGAGYRTGMVGKWHLGLTYRRHNGSEADGWSDADLTQPLVDCPLDHGFDFFFGMSRSHGTSGPNGDKNNTPDQTRGPGWIDGRKIAGATTNGKQLDGSYRLDEVGNVLDRHAMAFLQSAERSRQPFFLYFASPANHAPYTPSQAIGGMPILGASRYVNGSLTKLKRQDFVYQNDVHLARLLKYLSGTIDPRRPGRPLIENTIVVFASDNGAERNNKQFTGPLRSNKGSLYEGGHRIPFIIAWKNGGIGNGNSQTPGVTRTGLLGLNDLYATCAEILERPLPPVSGKSVGAEDSVSRLAEMRSGQATPRAPIYPNDHKEAVKKLSNARAWVAIRSNAAPIPGQWKLLLDHTFAYHGEVHPKELYNLATDPQEQHNLIEDPSALRALEFLMGQAKAAAGDHGHSRTVRKPNGDE